MKRTTEVYYCLDRDMHVAYVARRAKCIPPKARLAGLAIDGKVKIEHQIPIGEIDQPVLIEKVKSALAMIG